MEIALCNVIVSLQEQTLDVKVKATFDSRRPAKLLAYVVQKGKR